MAESPTDRVALSAPKGIIALIITGLLSGGIGATANGMTWGSAPVPAPPCLTRAEIEAVAVSKADEAVAKATEEMRRELGSNMAVVAQSLARIEAATTKLATDTEQLKVAMAGLKAPKGR